MSDAGGFKLGEQIPAMLWKIPFFIIIVAFVYIGILHDLNVRDDTKEILFDSFISRTKYCVEEGKDLSECFQNKDVYYGLKLSKGNEINYVNELFFGKCMKCVKKEKEFFIKEKDGELERYKLEVIYVA